MIRPFAKSDFVVTFYGECPASKLITGWEEVLDYIDKEINGDLEKDDDRRIDIRSNDCKFNDPDSWATLGSCYIGNDDERHTYSEPEFIYCVGLAIVRITEYATD